MTFLELCQRRYSVRSYENRPIEAEKLDYIKQCACLAPSAVNRQPWRMRLFTSADDLQRVAECYNRDWIRSAPAVILVTARTDIAWVRASDHKPHADVDAAIVTEHICLAAAEQGLGTCWVCNFDAQRLRDVMHLPAEEEPVVLVPIGYAATPDIPAKNRLDIEEIWINSNY